MLFASPVLTGDVTHMTNPRRREMALDLSMDVSYGRSVRVCCWPGLLRGHS